MNKAVNITEEMISEPLVVGAEAYVSEDYARAKADGYGPRCGSTPAGSRKSPRSATTSPTTSWTTVIIVRSAPDGSAYYNVCHSRPPADGWLRTPSSRCRFHGWRCIERQGRACPRGDWEAR